MAGLFCTHFGREILLLFMADLEDISQLDGGKTIKTGHPKELFWHLEKMVGLEFVGFFSFELPRRSVTFFKNVLSSVKVRVFYLSSFRVDFAILCGAELWFPFLESQTPSSRRCFCRTPTSLPEKSFVWKPEIPELVSSSRLPDVKGH